MGRGRLAGPPRHLSPPTPTTTTTTTTSHRDAAPSASENAPPPLPVSQSSASRNYSSVLPLLAYPRLASPSIPFPSSFPSTCSLPLSAVRCSLSPCLQGCLSLHPPQHKVGTSQYLYFYISSRNKRTRTDVDPSPSSVHFHKLACFHYQSTFNSASGILFTAPPTTIPNSTHRESSWRIRTLLPTYAPHFAHDGFTPVLRQGYHYRLRARTQTSRLS